MCRDRLTIAELRLRAGISLLVRMLSRSRANPWAKLGGGWTTPQEAQYRVVLKRALVRCRQELDMLMEVEQGERQFTPATARRIYGGGP